jgi:hypothetical protein
MKAALTETVLHTTSGLRAYCDENAFQRDGSVSPLLYTPSWRHLCWKCACSISSLLPGTVRAARLAKTKE